MACKDGNRGSGWCNNTLTAPPKFRLLITALCFLAFQGYLVHHITHLLRCHFGIYLCGGNVLVSQIGLNDCHIRAHFHMQASEGMARAMKCYLLGYSCCREPPFQRSLQHLVLEAVKDKPLAPFPEQSVCFIADGVVYYLLRLLHTGGHEHLAVGVRLYLLPSELPDVALPQSGEAAEKESPLQDFLLTGRFGKSYQLLLAQMFPYGRNTLDAV